MTRLGRARGDRGSSRAATDDLLGDLASRRWRPAAWARLVASATRRSVEQARAHPRAFGEVSALHCVLAALASPSGRRWVATSWLMASTHLGLLEDRSHLGVANGITLWRGNLPAVVTARHPWLGSVAAATDFADGRIARHSATTTVFGTYADVVADASFWIWFTTDRDEDHGARTAAVLIWLLPVTAVTVLSIARGRMVDVPRPRWIRPAATLQVVLAGRALWRGQQIPRAPSRTSPAV